MTRTIRLLSASLVLALVAPALVGVPAVVAVDYLDPTFGTGGRAVQEGLGPARAVVMQADGKIVVIGGASGFSLTRFTATGALDTSFDGDGFASVGSGSATSVAIQADGKFVMAGTTDLEGMPGFCCRLGVARLNANGSPDTSFSGDGFVVANPGPIMYGGGVAVQADGKVIVGGVQTQPPNRGIYVGRFNSNGTVDGTFGSAGFTMSNLSGTAEAGPLALQSDGKIVLGGSAGSNSDYLIARFTSGGLPDATFSGDGQVSVGFTAQGISESDLLTDIALQPDGGIVALGTSGPRFGLARLTSAGILDTTFDGDGRVETQFLGSGYSASAASLAMQADGRIVAVGTLFHDFDASFAITRYASDGWLDAKTTLDFGDPADVGVLCPPARPDCSEDRATDVAVQADGKLVVVGGAGPCGAPCHMALARYTDLPPIKDLRAAPAAVDLGTITVGGPPSEAVVTITNTGSTNVAIGTIALVDAELGLALGGEDCPTTLAARATCEVVLAFDPPSQGDVTAELRVNSDAPTSPLIIPVSGVAVLPVSGVVWGSRSLAGPNRTWNGGGALARTVKDGAQRLHLAYATNRVNGAWAKNTGPYVGVYYIRGTSGSTWATPKRVNPSGQHAARLGLAAAGSRVYATWVSQTKWTNFSPTAPRVLYVRVNTNHGAGTTWRSTVRLTTTSGRVDYPTIAASGTDVHIAYTDSVTGSIRLSTSRDRGVTWKKASLGSTSVADSSGKFGLPSVAVAGSIVIVAWLSDPAGTVKARVSTDRGVTWGSTVTVGSQSAGALSVAALGNRTAVAWTTPNAVVIRTATNGTWGAAKVLEQLDPEGQLSPYGPQVVLQGNSAIGVAWAKQVPGDFSVNLRWAESADGGELWFATQTIANSPNPQRANDWPSVLWPTAGARYVVWNGWDAFDAEYRLYFRAGTGNASTSAVAAADWVPSAGAMLPWVDSSIGDRFRAMRR